METWITLAGSDPESVRIYVACVFEILKDAGPWGELSDNAVTDLMADTVQTLCIHEALGE